MAKEQALPLNPSRISGVCGRIKCCMSYEYLAYRDLARGLPHVGDKINTLAGKGKVLDINILKRLILVDLGEGKTTKVFFPKDENAPLRKEAVVDEKEIKLKEDEIIGLKDEP
jgi:cell fate regulator YaaT (PSP1 superfamily)